jgi:hypothetical protein
MDPKSMERLKFDRRLIRRRNWISKDELERELAALPDASDKVAPPEEESGRASSASDDPQPE